MTDPELLEKLLSHFKDVSKMLSLGNLELLKSEELYNNKYKIEDMLGMYKPFFPEKEVLKINEVLPKQRITPQSGVFLASEKVNFELKDLYILLKELIKIKGGSEINLDSVTRASGF